MYHRAKSRSFRWIRALAHLPFLIIALGSSCSSPTEQSHKNPQTIDRIYSDLKKDFPDIDDITPAELLEVLNNKVDCVIVDVRPHQERKVSTIPGALSKEEFEKRFSQKSPTLVVTYCTVGYRSGVYAQKISKRYRVKNLRGSLMAWVHAGGEIVNEKGTTKEVHVYAPSWNYLPTGYIAVH